MIGLIPSADSPERIAPPQPAREEPPALAPLVDPFGRMVSYLRVSLTDRCNLRCHYCMAEDMVFLPRSDVLTL